MPYYLDIIKKLRIPSVFFSHEQKEIDKYREGIASAILKKKGVYKN